MQIREFRFKDIEDIMDTLYSVMKYQVMHQKLNDVQIKQVLQNIFEYWMESNSYKQVGYQLFIVEEKLSTLKEYVLSLREINQEKQLQKIQWICQRIYDDISGIYFKQYNSIFNQREQPYLKYYIEFTFRDLLIKKKVKVQVWDQNIYLFDQHNSQIEDIPIYSFRSKNLLQTGKLNEQVRDQITKEKIISHIFYELYQYSKTKKIDKLVKYLEKASFKDYYDIANYISKPINLSINQQRINKQKHYIQLKKLGKGGFGNVYQVQVNDQSKDIFALKEIKGYTLKKLSFVIVEMSLNLMFDFKNTKIPLLKCEDLFLLFDDFKKQFTLNLVMQQGDNDLLKIIRENGKQPLQFDKLFPIFRDTIFGLTFMFLNNITHRDIKPENIFKVKGMYYLADFGGGINLYYESEIGGDLYMINQWPIFGTKSYFDPIIKQQHFKLVNGQSDELSIKVDLFKADIYSLGLSFYYAATGKHPRSINQQNYDQKKCYLEIHKLKIPIQMKNMILHMIQFDTDYRIPIYALHCSLKQLMIRLMKSEQLNPVQQPIMNKEYYAMIKFDRKNYDWFQIDKFAYRNGWVQFNHKYEKIIKKANKDQSFFTGDQKIDYNISKNNLQQVKNLTKGQIIILRPNFILCTFDQQLSNDQNKCQVCINLKKLTVETKNIQTIQFQQYVTNQILEHYNKFTDNWECCKVQTIEQGQYVIEIKSNNKSISLPFNTLKLRPCLSHQSIVHDQKVQTKYYSENLGIAKDEQQLLTYDRQIINVKQLFRQLDYDLSNQQTDITDIIEKIQQFKVNNGFNGLLNIYVDRESQSKLYSLLDQGLDQIDISMFFGKNLQIKQSLLDSFQSGQIKMLKLYEIKMTFDQFICLFKVFGSKKLERFLFYADNELKFQQTPTQNDLDELNQFFTQFAKNQSQLYYFYFLVSFEGQDQQVELMKQFKNIVILINDNGFRFETFLFEIYMDWGNQEMVEQFAAEIKKDFNKKYRHKWTCELDYGGLRIEK